MHMSDGGGDLPSPRSSSVSAVSRVSSTPTSSQLTPAKRSVSTSISNFFKRISPHLGRKRSRDRSNNSSRAGSSQSLPAAAGVTVDPETPSPTMQHSAAPAASSGSSSGSSHFSRSRIRNSFLKLMGGSRKDSKSKVSAAISSSSGSASPQAADLNVSGGSQGSETSSDKNSALDADRRLSSKGMPESAQRKLKSMEKSSFGKKDVYREFKDKRSPHGASAGSIAAVDANLEERYRAIKAQYKDRPRLLDEELSFDAYDGTSALSTYPRSGVRSESISSPSEEEVPTPETLGAGEGEAGVRAGKAEPPSSLDVVPPRAIRLLQASTVSTISGDESIGECSLDCNLTGK